MAEGQDVANRVQVRSGAGRIELDVLAGDRTLASAAVSLEHAVKLQDDLGSALLEGVLDSRWKCPKCGNSHVQVSLPTWYRETSGGMMANKTVYIVAVYLRDRAYGGPEEGGWWYDTGEMMRIIRTFKDEERAGAHATRMNSLLNATINKGRREISSVLSDGRYYAEVHENIAPHHYPECRPHYE